MVAGPVHFSEAATAANTAAMTADNARQVWTTPEYRPSAQTTVDGPGRCAHSYGTEGRARPPGLVTTSSAEGFKRIPSARHGWRLGPATRAGTSNQGRLKWPGDWATCGQDRRGAAPQQAAGQSQSRSGMIAQRAWPFGSDLAGVGTVMITCGRASGVTGSHRSVANQPDHGQPRLRRRRAGGTVTEFSWPLEF